MNLRDKRILITRPRARAQEFASALVSEGAQPIIFPVTEILAPHDFSKFDSALSNLNQYDWLIVTSVYGVEALISRLIIHGIKYLPAKLRVAAVGKKTMFTLAENNIKTHFVPSQFTGMALAHGIGHMVGKRFLLLQSDLADPELGRYIRAKNGYANEVIVYRNIPAEIRGMDIEALNSGVDVVTFASPSAVKGFVHAGCEHGFDISYLPGNPITACIGPVTARAIRDAGLSVDLEASEHTAKGMIVALKNFKNHVTLSVAKGLYDNLKDPSLRSGNHI